MIRIALWFFFGVFVGYQCALPIDADSVNSNADCVTDTECQATDGKEI